MMRAIISMFLMAILITGCATNDYALYAETQQKIAQAHAMADTARYAALADIAKNGDSAAKVAAVMSLQLGGGSGGSGGPRIQQVTPPKSLGETALQWTSVLLPAAMQGLAVGAQVHAANAQRQVAITQSNNALATAQSTNNTFATMSNNQASSNTAIATAGFTAATNIANSGLTAATTLGSAGITGVNNTASSGFTAVNTAANSGLTAATTLGSAGITGVNNTASSGFTAVNAAVANGNALTNNVATGYTSALQAAINKLTGTTTTTTTTTSNTSNTTTTNNVCPVGQALVNGNCV